MKINIPVVEHAEAIYLEDLSPEEIERVLNENPVFFGNITVDNILDTSQSPEFYYNEDGFKKDYIEL